jgi:hypothetical protein
VREGLRVVAELFASTGLDFLGEQPQRAGVAEQLLDIGSTSSAASRSCRPYART